MFRGRRLVRAPAPSPKPTSTSFFRRALRIRCSEMMKAVRPVIFVIFCIEVVVGLEENCTDFQGRTIAHGLLYVPGPAVCTMCVCYHSEPMWCKAIYCDPPYFCKKFRVGERCCEFECLDPPGEEAFRMLERYRQRNRHNGASPPQAPVLLLAATSLLALHALKTSAH